MTFDDLWEHACSISDFTEGARVHLPASLSDKTKTIIVEKELSADEFAGIVLNTINQINSGSVESIDDLVMESLEKRLVMKHKPYGPYEKYIKRPLDCFLAICAFVILSPVLGIVALLVSKKLGTPVLFSQERPGKDGKIFKIFKFRTMTDEKDENGELLPDEIRLTSFGKKLRSTSLDELPELINIIRGDMAVVGPRPLLVKYLPYYTEEQHHRHDIRPGLTGYAQVHGRNTVNWDDKFRMDLDYASHITFLGDLKIVLETVGKVFKREGISSETSATMEDFRDYCASVGRVPEGVVRK